MGYCSLEWDKLHKHENYLLFYYSLFINCGSLKVEAFMLTNNTATWNSALFFNLF